MSSLQQSITFAPENSTPEAVCRREDFVVRDVSFLEASELIQRHHYSKSSGQGSAYRHGLFDLQGNLLGVAWWLPPLPPAAMGLAEFLGGKPQWVLNLSRLVVVPGVPKGCTSLLLGRSMRMIDRRRWPILLTFADTNQVDPRTGLHHTGTIYKATNWVELGPVEAGRVWVHKVTGEQRGTKRGPHNLTHAEMRALGFVKQPQAPKIKFYHVDKHALRWAAQHWPKLHGKKVVQKKKSVPKVDPRQTRLFDEE